MFRAGGQSSKMNSYCPATDSRAPFRRVSRCSSSTSSTSAPARSRLAGIRSYPPDSDFCRAESAVASPSNTRSEEHTSELQSLRHLVCRLLLEKKKADVEEKCGDGVEEHPDVDPSPDEGGV